MNQILSRHRLHSLYPFSFHNSTITIAFSGNGEWMNECKTCPACALLNSHYCSEQGGPNGFLSHHCIITSCLLNFHAYDITDNCEGCFSHADVHWSILFFLLLEGWHAKVFIFVPTALAGLLLTVYATNTVFPLVHISCYGFQSVKELPEAAIPNILTFLEVEDVCRCACIARAWSSCVQHRSVVSRVHKTNLSYRWQNTANVAALLSCSLSEIAAKAMVDHY